jgi:Protein of unknown function (DUF4240)
MVDKKRFWAIIAASRQEADGDEEAQLDAFREELATLNSDELVDFQRQWDELHAQAYSWDLWGAAYLIGGGCSDDGFIDFRAWLIMQGQKVYENALNDSDSLARAVAEDDGEATQWEGPQYIAIDVWTEKTGKDPSEFPERTIRQPADPTGKQSTESDDELKKRFPKLWEKFGG